MSTVRLDSPSHDVDAGVVQEVPDQRQAIRDDVVRRMALDIARVFLRLGELQQAHDDLAHALDLLVEQTEFGFGQRRLAAHERAHDL